MKLEQQKSYKWILVGSLWLVGCLNYMDRQAIFSVFPLLKAELGTSDIELALLGSGFLWAYGVSSPFAGYLGDRFRRKDVILWSLSLFSLVTLATGLARASWQLICLRGLLGISEALYIPTALAFIADYHSGQTRSRAIGIHQTSLLLGAVLGGAFAGYMGDRYWWRGTFFLLGGAGLFLTAVLMPLLRETTKGASDAPLFRETQASSGVAITESPASILRKPTVLCILFCGISVSMVGWAVMAWMPSYLHEKFGMSMMDAGLNAVMYVSISSMGGILTGSILADYWARRNLLARMLVQLIGLGVATPAVLGVGFADSAAVLLTLLVLFGLGRGLWDCNNMPLFCEVVAPGGRSMAYGIFNLANTLGGGLSVLLIGSLKETVGIGHGLSWLSLLLIMSVVLTFLAVRRFLRGDMENLRNRLLEGSHLAGSNYSRS